VSAKKLLSYSTYSKLPMGSACDVSHIAVSVY